MQSFTYIPPDCGVVPADCLNELRFSVMLSPRLLVTCPPDYYCQLSDESRHFIDIRSQLISTYLESRYGLERLVDTSVLPVPPSEIVSEIAYMLDCCCPDDRHISDPEFLHQRQGRRACSLILDIRKSNYRKTLCNE